MRYVRALDGVRALAVLAVFAAHLELPLAEGGWLGVDLFFVLSGFLITSILLHERESTGGIALCRFYIRRLLRLYPALLTMLAFSAICATTIVTDHSIGTFSIAATIAGSYTMDLAILVTGTGDFGALTHTWSLAVEEQFYLLWPLALLVILRSGRSVVRWAIGGAAVSLAILGYLLATTAITPGQTPLPYFYPHTRAYELLLGCALGAWVSSRNRCASSRWPTTVAGTGCLGILVVVGIVDAGGTRVMFPAIALAGVFSCMVIGGLACGAQGPLGQLLSLRPVVALGKISYGIYLWHLPVLWVISHRLVAPRPVLVSLSLVVSIGAAAACDRWIERPFRRIRDAMTDSQGSNVVRLETRVVDLTASARQSFPAQNPGHSGQPKS